MAGLPVEEAGSRILEEIQPQAPIELPLMEAHGCVLAADVTAEYDLPPFSSAEADGFAVRAADVHTATKDGPVKLRLAGLSMGGRPPEATVGWGEAVRVSRGAPMPAGADSVVSADLARAEGEEVWVSAPVPEGALIRPAGVDARSGEVLVPAGRRLSSPELGILAIAGQAGALAYPKVRVAVFAVGDLVEPGKPASVGELRDANSFAVYGALRDSDAQALRIGIVPDDDAELREAIVSNLTRADCFVCTVGAAATDPEIGAVGLMRDLDWLDVQMHPAVRLGFGLVEDTPFFALPGSPVSVFAAFELFVRPAILKMMGRGDVHRPEVHAVLDEPLGGPAGVGLYVPARISHRDGAWHARPTGPSDPNLLSPIVRANGLVVVAAGETEPSAGDRVRAQIFRPLER